MNGSRIDFDTTWYQQHHGKHPRGYRNWWFRASRYGVVLTEFPVHPTRSYGDAKQDAVAYVRTNFPTAHLIEPMP